VQRRQGSVVPVVASRAEQVKSAARHRLDLLHFAHVLLRLVSRGADGIDHALGLVGGVEMDERHLYCLAIGGERAVQTATVRGGLGKVQPLLAPQDARQFFD
jgi:hypothetical protein